MDLAGFQLRLSEQYTRLRDLRTTENYPVYAIEHGLTTDECLAAQTLLNANLSATMCPDRSYWLVWIAAAAEVGYRYDGTEYWDSFAAAFPDWPRFGDRNQIRVWYKQFAEDYRGLTPSGPWARQFPIIAWPITQAILPRYLQRHFANHLFDLRHVLVRSGELTLDEIGDLLSERYYGGSSRFEGFLQQKALTARIVMALGQEGIEDAVAPIEKIALDRIAGDIDKLGSFGARLREARRVLRDARFVNSSKQGFLPKTKQSPNAPAELTERTERPRLVARQTGADMWTLALALPDFATPLRQAGLAPRDIEQARMRFRAHTEGSAWSPGRALFSYNGQHEEPLAVYPTADIDVFTFDRPLATAQAILRERLIFSARPMRLMKVRADGAAFELAGRHVRVNHSYVLVASAPVAADTVETLGLSLLQSNTLAAYLWRFDVPSTLDTEKVAALHSLDLGYQLGVRVEPLGLSPRWATADGALVFLDTEAVMFCISSDVVIREFFIVVDALPPVRITPTASRNTLISLGSLPIGSHRIVVSALGAASGGDIVAENITVEVRAASPWRQSIEGKAGVGLRLDPREAPIEQFLDGTARIRVIAPPRRTIKVNSRFYGADGTLFHDEAFGRYNTPVSDDRLSGLIVQRLVSDAQLEHLERAARIEILISLDECGTETIAFEKDAEPLRWLRVDDRKVRLSDDTAETLPPTIERFDLDSVEAASVVDYQQAVVGIELRGKGGLFVATLNGRRYEAIATAIQRQLTDFTDLGVPANVSATPKQPQVLINALKRWHTTRRLMGPMAFLARRNAIRALENALAAALCGDDWVVAANRVLNGKQKIGDLYARVYYSRGFASGLANFAWRYETDESAANAEFVRLVDVYKIPTNSALIVLALRLAFKPYAVRSSDLQSSELFDALRNSQSLVRGAYFARLAAELRAQNKPSEVP